VAGVAALAAGAEAVSPEWIAAGCAALALAISGVNVYLNLRIKAMLLEERDRTHQWVEERLKQYVLEDVCQARHTPTRN
jgi:hypothetical protein